MWNLMPKNDFKRSLPKIELESRNFSLISINSEKDASRTRAIEMFPYFSSQLSKKKDSNKADAILIASFYHETYKLEE